jgi:hypothetical protein
VNESVEGIGFVSGTRSTKAESSRNVRQAGRIPRRTSVPDAAGPRTRGSISTVLAVRRGW